MNTTNKRDWSERDYVEALICFKKMENKSLDRIKLSSTASSIGCTQASLEMCMANYKWIKTQGLSGLSHIGKKQLEIFNKFYYLLP